VKRHKALAELAQTGIVERGQNLLASWPVRALKLREQRLVAMTVETAENLLLDR